MIKDRVKKDRRMSKLKLTQPQRLALAHAVQYQKYGVDSGSAEHGCRLETGRYKGMMPTTVISLKDRGILKIERYHWGYEVWPLPFTS
jgi:hypothetical protein